jgi:hypothetical protein
MYMLYALLKAAELVKEYSDALIKVERESICPKSRAPDGCGSAGFRQNEYV